MTAKGGGCVFVGLEAEPVHAPAGCGFVEPCLWHFKKAVPIPWSSFYKNLPTF
jgi:hypothetical protein